MPVAPQLEVELKPMVIFFILFEFSLGLVHAVPSPEFTYENSLLYSENTVVSFTQQPPLAFTIFCLPFHNNPPTLQGRV